MNWLRLCTSSRLIIFYVLIAGDKWKRGVRVYENIPCELAYFWGANVSLRQLMGIARVGSQLWYSSGIYKEVFCVALQWSNEALAWSRDPQLQTILEEIFKTRWPDNGRLQCESMSHLKISRNSIYQTIISWVGWWELFLRTFYGCKEGQFSQ